MPQTQPKCLKAQREAIEHEYMSLWPRKVHRISIAKPYPVSSHLCFFSKPIVVGFKSHASCDIYTDVPQWSPGLNLFHNCSFVGGLEMLIEFIQSYVNTTLPVWLVARLRETTDLPLSHPVKHKCSSYLPILEPTPYGLAAKRRSMRIKRSRPLLL